MKLIAKEAHEHFIFGLASDDANKPWLKFIAHEPSGTVFLESPDGDVQFNIKKKKFNIYTDQSDDHVDIYKKKFDIFGPKDFQNLKCKRISHIYRPSKRQLTFETLETKDISHIWNYQNDSEYYLRHKTKRMDNLPMLYKFKEELNPFIIHAIDKDRNSYIDITNIDGLNVKTFHGCGLHFADIDDILQFCDFGEPMIKEYVPNLIKRKKYVIYQTYAFYESMKNINSERRKKAIKTNSQKGYNTFDWRIKFNDFSRKTFSITLFRDIITSNEKNGLTDQVLGSPDIILTGNYDFIEKKIHIDGYETIQHLYHELNALGMQYELNLRRLLKIWFNTNPIYIKLDMIKRANPLNVSRDSLILRSCLENLQTGLNDFVFEEIKVNLWDFIINFMRPNAYLENCVVTNTIPKEFPCNIDNEMLSPWISLHNAIKIIKYESIKVKHNTYWYTNANKLLTVFGDIDE